MRFKSYRHLPSIARTAVLAAALAPTLAFAGELSVTGEGNVQYTPDSVRLQFSARAENADPQKATQAVREAIANWEENIKAYRNQLDDYNNATLNLYTQRIPPRKEGGEPQVRSVASQTVSFTLSALDTLNPVLEAAQDSDLEYHIGDGNFYHSKEDSLQQQALGQAIDDAKAQCEFIAKRLNQSCGEVKSISTNGSSRPMPMMMADARGKSEPVTAVGKRTVNVSVSATFEID